MAPATPNMSSIKSRLVLALGIVELMMLAMAAVLYFGASQLSESRQRTAEANGEVRELLSFALLAHQYMTAFEQSLGQRTLIANQQRRVASAAFEERIRGIDSKANEKSAWGTLDWSELRSISKDLHAELRAADALREKGRFYEAERIFAGARKNHFDGRMLSWFDRALDILGADASSEETKADATASRLRLTGTLLGCLSALVASAAVLAISRSILSPVAALVRGTEEIGRGNLSYRVAQRGRDELALLADRFNGMAQTLAGAQAKLIERNGQLEEAYRLQSEFLSIVSHELRSPLHSVIGYTELVIEDEPGLAAQSRNNLFAIGGAARRLLSLINDILDFSKLRAGRMEARAERFELMPLLAVVLEDARALVRGRPVELVLDAPAQSVSVESDEMKIRQILTNLLSNAVKFTDTGTVTLRAAAVSQGIELEVSDTGIGIPSEQLELVFEPFHQARSGDAQVSGGTGLGLAIVARLAKLLGGRVAVRSELGKGSRFSVFLPSVI